MGRVMVQAPVVKRVEPRGEAHNGWTEEDIQEIIVGEWKDRQKTYKVYTTIYGHDKYSKGHSNLSFDVDYYSEDDQLQSRPKLITIITRRTGCEIHWGRGPTPSYVVQMENLTATNLTWIKPNGTRGSFAWTKMIEGASDQKNSARGLACRSVQMKAPTAKALPPVKAVPPQRPGRPGMDTALTGPPPKAPPPQLAVVEKQRQRLVHMAPAPELPPPPPPDEEEDEHFPMTLPPVPLPHLSPAEAEDHPLSEQPEVLDYEEMEEEDFPEEMDLGMEAALFCPPPSYAPPAPPGYSAQAPGDSEAEACEGEPDRCPPPIMAPPPAPPSSYGHSTHLPEGTVQASQLERNMPRVEGLGGPPGLDPPEEEDELPLDTLDMPFLDEEDDFLHEAMPFGSYAVGNLNGRLGIGGMQGNAPVESDAPGEDAWRTGALLWGKAALDEDVSFPPRAASSSAIPKDTWTRNGKLPSHHGGEVAPDVLPAPGLAALGLAAPIQNGRCEDPWTEEQWGGASQWSQNLAEEAMLADANGSLESEGTTEVPADSLESYADDFLDETCAPAKDPFRELPQAAVKPAPTREEKMKLDQLSADLRDALNLGFGCDAGEEEEEEKEEASAALAATRPRFQAPANGQYFRSQPDHSESYAHSDQQNAGVALQDGQGRWYMMVPPGSNSSQLQYSDMQWMQPEAQNFLLQYDGPYHMQTAMQGGGYPSMYRHYGMLQQGGQMHQSARGNMMSSENGKKRSQRSEQQMQASSAEGNHQGSQARLGRLDSSFNNAALPKALRQSLAMRRGTDETASSAQEVYDSPYDYRSSGHHQYGNDGRSKQDYSHRRGSQRWLDRDYRDYDRNLVPREITIGDENDWR